jgi:hypothetical protein
MMRDQDIQMMAAMGYRAKEIDRIATRLYNGNFRFTHDNCDVDFDTARDLIGNDSEFLQGLALAAKFAPVSRQTCNGDGHVRIEETIQMS